MTEHLVIGPCTLYHADALETMRALAAGGTRADCLVCDPPYLLTSGGGVPKYEGAQRMGGCFNPKTYDNGGHLVACDIDWMDFMPPFYQALGERAHAYVMANNRNVQPMLNAAEKAGFEFHNLLVWDKVSATPNRWYMKNAEFTGLFYKGKAFAINDCSSMSCVRLSHTDDSQHPTEKPVALMEMYIRNSTQPGALVIDPFMGSGTTGVAAIRAGRRFIGIELDERWYAVAEKRIRHALEYAQRSLF
jgi:site-specific DNA-methyltransferase (adenine-specific)